MGGRRSTYEGIFTAKIFREIECLPEWQHSIFVPETAHQLRRTKEGK